MRLVHFSAKAKITPEQRWKTKGNQMGRKPQGGLWVSDEAAVRQGWHNFCTSSNFRLSSLRWAHPVEIAGSAAVLWIDSREGIDWMSREYGSTGPERSETWTCKLLDWARIRADWDAVLITPLVRGGAARSGHWYEPWDCASGVILDSSIVRLGPPVRGQSFAGSFTRMPEYRFSNYPLRRTPANPSTVLEYLRMEVECEPAESLVDCWNMVVDSIGPPHEAADSACLLLAEACGGVADLAFGEDPDTSKIGAAQRKIAATDDSLGFGAGRAQEERRRIADEAIRLAAESTGWSLPGSELLYWLAAAAEDEERASVPAAWDAVAEELGARPEACDAGLKALARSCQERGLAIPSADPRSGSRWALEALDGAPKGQRGNARRVNVIMTAFSYAQDAETAAGQ